MEKPFTDKEIQLLKYLNRKGIIEKKAGDAIAAIKIYLKLVNLERDPKLFYFLFKDNYRPEGDYENVTWQDFVDVRNQKIRKISNYEASEYVALKRPFKGSNLSAGWKVAGNYLIYVVLSYGHYPIYIYRDGLWFINSDHYSTSTAKHIRAATPRYDHSKIVMIEPDLMMDVYRGNLSNDEVMNLRMGRFKKKIKYLVPQRLTNVNAFWLTNQKIKFKIKDVILSDQETIEIIIDVLGLYDGSNRIDYEQTELIDKKSIEEKINQKILSNMREYLPPSTIGRYIDYTDIPEDGFLKLTFKHRPF
jgi:hypothetical protein